MLISPCRALILDLFQAVLRSTDRSSAVDKFKTAVADFGEELPEVLSAIIFAKRQELCKYLTHRVFTQTTD